MSIPPGARRPSHGKTGRPELKRATPSVAKLETETVEGALRVKGAIEGRVGFELWLPKAWNGRYYQLGTGGFAGQIFPEMLAYEARQGNAAAMTDTGHAADNTDASWAVGNWQALLDYGHRSIKLLSDVAGGLIETHYGVCAAWRYFAGCSNGGRQALMAAQRYPDDWDGIVAGAPANQWTQQLRNLAKIQHALRARPGGWIAVQDLRAIRSAALAGCLTDSIENGIALDPLSGRFDPDEAGLSAVQTESLRLIIEAGFEPTCAGAEWASWIVNPDRSAHSQLLFAEQAFRHLLKDQPDWSVEDFDAERDRVDETTADVLDVDRTDFSAFRERGGRVLSYFGWADALIAPRAHLDWYRSLGNVRDFYRLFMVPGMAHCQGGGVPDSFGQSSVSPSLTDDPLHNIRRAIEEWVESDYTPEALVATRFVDGKPDSTRELLPV